MSKSQSIVDLWCAWGRLLSPDNTDSPIEVAATLEIVIGRLTCLSLTLHDISLEQCLKEYVKLGWIE